MNVKVSEKIKFVPVDVQSSRYEAGTIFLFQDGKTACILVEICSGYPLLVDLKDGDVYHEFTGTDYELPTPQQVAYETGSQFMVLEKDKVSVNIEVVN